MTNKFGKNYNSNYRLYDDLVEHGKISQEDLDAAANYGGKYSYAQQDAANERIYTYLKEFVKKNPDDEEGLQAFESFPVVEKFEPNPSKWQEYDQEQMGRLAESLHYNWNNKEDRSKMMRELQNNTIRENKKKVYEEYKKEHPVASWLNENVLAPNASERSKKGDDITNKDIALDALNAASFLTPGGVGKTTLQKGAWLAGDIAANAALGVAEDLNQDRELGLHNVVAPVFGAGLGQTIAAAPRLAKQVVDWLGNGADAGKVGKGVGDKFEDWLTDTFTDKASRAKETLKKEAEIWKEKPTVRTNASQESKNKLLNEGIIPEPNSYDKRLANKKAYYAENPDKFKANKDAALKEELLKDPNFKTVIDDYNKRMNMTTAQRVGDNLLKQSGTGLFKQGGRAVPYIQQNTARHKESNQERSDINWFKENYARDWAAGFAPRGKEDEPIMKAYREWQEENKQTKPKFSDIMRGE